MKKLFIYILLPIIILLTIIIVPISLKYADEKEIDITISDKYTKGESGTYFVVDENSNAYVVEDLFLIGKFNSTDIYNKLKIGNKYKVKITGVRNHFFSWYQNINEIIEENE